jgi:hypothetical protein
LLDGLLLSRIQAVEGLLERSGLWVSHGLSIVQ